MFDKSPAIVDICSTWPGPKPESRLVDDAAVEAAKQKELVPPFSVGLSVDEIRTEHGTT